MSANLAHTPGPWVVVAGAAYEQIEAENGPLICFAASNNWASKANARLISKSPAMLSMLIAVRDADPEGIAHLDIDGLIAEATGGAA